MESLIRLSEAIARVYLLQDITVEHVWQASALLSSSSIQKIEKTDLEMDKEAAVAAAVRQTEEDAPLNIVVRSNFYYIKFIKN